MFQPVEGIRGAEGGRESRMCPKDTQTCWGVELWKAQGQRMRKVSVNIQAIFIRRSMDGYSWSTIGQVNESTSLKDGDRL